MTPPRWTDEAKAELRRRVEAGETYAAIGLAMGVTRNAALGMAQRMFLCQPRPKLKPEAAEPRPSQVFPPAGTCLFSADRAVPYQFCGAPVARFGEVWCAQHRKQVFNLQVLCADCNAGKGNHDQTDWR